MKKARNAEYSQGQQLSLPLYLGEPFLPVKKKVRNFEGRVAIDGIKSHSLTLKRLLDSGDIQSSDARLQIQNFLRILGLK